MTLKKAIKHNKEFREEYRGSARFDKQCRHGGSCTICSNNRQFVGNKLKLTSARALVEDELEDDLENSKAIAKKQAEEAAEAEAYEDFSTYLRSITGP